MYRESEDSTEFHILARCARYAIIRTSINALVDSQVPALVARAVETGLWLTERALSLAMRMSGPQRTSMFTLLLRLDSLSDVERDLALEQGMAAVLAISDEQEGTGPGCPGPTTDRYAIGTSVRHPMIGYAPFQALTLAALAPQLMGEAREQMLARGLADVLAVDDSYYRDHALAALAPHLTGALLERCLAPSRLSAMRKAGGGILATLAPRLAEPQLGRALLPLTPSMRSCIGHRPWLPWLRNLRVRLGTRCWRRPRLIH